jgi:hypothetical protein
MRFEPRPLAYALFEAHDALATAGGRRPFRIRVHPDATWEAVVFALATWSNVPLSDGWRHEGGVHTFARMPLVVDGSLPDDGTIVIETQDEVVVSTHGRDVPLGIRYATRLQVVVQIKPEET